MATFSNAQAIYGLQATAAPVGTNVSGNQTVGIQPVVLLFSSANAAYSFKVSAATTANTAAWTLATGICIAGAGTPVITDGDGRDCEGITLPTMDGVYAIQIKTTATNTNVVTLAVSDADFPSGTVQPGTTWLCTSADPFGTGVVTMTFAAGGDTIEIVALGSP